MITIDPFYYIKQRSFVLLFLITSSLFCNELVAETQDSTLINAQYSEDDSKDVETQSSENEVVDNSLNNDSVNKDSVNKDSVNKDSLNEEQLESKMVTKDLGSKEKIYQSAIGFVQWIDNYFGEPEELESASYDFLRLVNVVGWREDEGLQYHPRIKAKVNLPKIDKKFSLMFADSDEITNTDYESIQSNDIFNKNNDHKSSAAINYESDYYNKSKFDTRIGVDSSLDLFALFKHTYQIFKDEDTVLRNYNYIFWREKEHFGINPRIELDHIINDNNLFRWKYSILLSEKSLGNEWKNTFSFVNRYSKESWISYDFDISGVSAYQYDVETYRLAVRYRRQLDIKWLYFEVEPEILWHREPEYVERKIIPGLIFRLEVQFEH